MKQTLVILLILAQACAAPSCSTEPEVESSTSGTQRVEPPVDVATNAPVTAVSEASPASLERVVRTDEEWRELLEPEIYHVTREAGTEYPRTGKYWDEKRSGVYACVCCDLDLFGSETKFKSGTGWPSFWRPIETQNVGEVEDRSHFSVRTEVICNRCDAHLGHVFPDGPKPTGLRYCINSASLTLRESERPASEH